MRDARTQGREIGRAWRDRDLARRRGREAIDFVLEAFLRVAGAIVLNTLAFSVWNIGTRSPATVLRDVRAHVRESHALVVGSLRLIIGTLFVAAGAVLVLPAVADPSADFAPIEVLAILVALTLEHIVGADIRRTG